MFASAIRCCGIALVFTLVSCAGDETMGEDPVASQEESGQIPDMPGEMGDAGEAEPNLVGEGGDESASAQEGAGMDVNNQAGESADMGASAPREVEMYVVPSALNVRPGPGMEYKPVRTVLGGEKVVVMGCDGIWCRIGEREFVSNKHLSDTPPQ